MAKVTSKLQVTIPKALASEYGIEPGDEIEFRPAGPEIRVIPPRAQRKGLSVAERLRLFDESTARIAERARELSITAPASGRGWTREDLYTRGSARTGPPPHGSGRDRKDGEAGDEDAG